MYQLIRKISLDQVDGWFVMHLLINLVICSTLYPILNKYSTEYIVGHQISKGVIFLVYLTLLEIIMSLYDFYILDNYKWTFKKYAHGIVEREMVEKLSKLNWHTIRDLNNTEIEKKKNNAKWPIICFAQGLVCDVIDCVPIIGSIIWLLIISFWSTLFFLTGMVLIIKLYSEESRDRETLHDIWDRYSFLQSGFFTEIIHHRSENSVEELVLSMENHENQRSAEQQKSKKYLTILNVSYDIIFSIILLCFISRLESIVDVVVYLNLMRSLQSYCFRIINLYKLYDEANREYMKIDKVLFSLGERKNVDQLNSFVEMTIENLSYTYPKKEQNLIPMSILSHTQITFQTGQIVKLSGNSGNGKSTFLDIINGIIPHPEYASQIKFDGKYGVYGFDSITTHRIYVEQLENINWKVSIYEIITGESCNEKNTYLKKEELAWQSLGNACCHEFLKKNNDKNEKKSIYTKNVCPSVGQKERIRVARFWYRLLKDSPLMVTLDEIDKAIQSEMVVEILNNIYDYCRNNKILCFVVAHSTEVKKMKYDMEINFENGVMSTI